MPPSAPSFPRKVSVFVPCVLGSFLKSCCLCCLVSQSCPTLCNPMNLARQVPLSMGFPRQEYWTGLPFPSSEDLPDPGIKPESPALAGRFFTAEPPGKPIKKKKCTSHKIYHLNHFYVSVSLSSFTSLCNHHTIVSRTLHIAN